MLDFKTAIDDVGAGYSDLNMLAEDIETRREMACLSELGVRLMQGYLFAKPGFASLPELDFTNL
ncbi:hypothetical protein NMD14_19305 [Aeromonas veronii]